MYSIDVELVDLLRSMGRRGEHASTMLRTILAHFSLTNGDRILEPGDRILLVEYFSIAFCSKEGQGQPIFGLFPDESGYLKDTELDGLMVKRIQKTRPEWDQPDVARVGRG